MDLSTIIALVTMVVTMILGYLSKKSTFISNKVIPLQNIVIGIVVALVEFLITKDFSTAIAMSGIFAGGTYDIIHNLEKIIKNEG